MARAILSASASSVTVSGLVLGISNTVVTPPSTAARRTGLQVLLVLEARLAEMHLTVDHAGQNVQAGAVDDIAGCGGIDRADGRDAAVGDADIAHADAVHD